MATYDLVETLDKAQTASGKHYLADFTPTPFNHLMVDIETDDSKPTSIIRSVAIVAFDPYATLGVGVAPVPLLHIHIDRNVQFAQGRTRSKDTIYWWNEQSIEAQIRSLEGQLNAVTPERARELIDYTLAEYNHIWANGPDFDCVVLRDFMGDGYKWPFWKHRCVRTIKNLWHDKVAAVPKPQVAHDALEDCMYQIAQVQAALTPCTQHSVPDTNEA